MYAYEVWDRIVEARGKVLEKSGGGGRGGGGRVGRGFWEYRVVKWREDFWSH